MCLMAAHPFRDCAIRPRGINVFFSTLVMSVEKEIGDELTIYNVQVDYHYNVQHTASQ